MEVLLICIALIAIIAVVISIKVTVDFLYNRKETKCEIKRIEDIANNADLTNRLNSSKLDSQHHHLVELTLRASKLKQQIAKLEKKVYELEKELKQ